MHDTHDRVIALGFFDGVHRGHAELLKRTAFISEALGASASVLTFDSHPETLIVGKAMPLINSPSDRAELMRTLYGIKEVIFAHFDEDMMAMEWDAFISDFLIKRYRAVHLVAGHDFHFGYKGEGNAALLSEFCGKHDIGCDIIPKVELHKITVSSTYIRKLVAQGDMERAREFLGHAHMFTAVVATGNKIGRTIGCPTINMSIPPDVIIPARGVYATKTVTNGISYPSVTNIGVKPTVTSDSRVIAETHIIGYTGDLYGSPACVEFYKFLRPEQKFDGIEALRNQINFDISEVKSYFGRD